MERRVHGVRLDFGTRHVEDEALGNIEDEQLSVGRVQSVTRMPVATRARSRSEDPMTTPMAFQTTMSLVGLGYTQWRNASEDSYLAIWSDTKPENLAADVRLRWKGGHECRADVSMRGSQP